MSAVKRKNVNPCLCECVCICLSERGVRETHRQREWRAVEPLDPVNCRVAINESSKQVTQCSEECSRCPSRGEERGREKLSGSFFYSEQNRRWEGRQVERQVSQVRI